MEPNSLPFELRKANIENSLNKESYLEVIEKSEHQSHKYIRKEGDRYIYEGASVKTPHGHGKVISVKRHPVDINHIQSVKVRVNDKEHDLSSEDVRAHTNEFDEKDKKELKRVMELSKKFKDQQVLGFSDINHIDRVRANVKGLLHKDDGVRNYRRRSLQEGPGGITNNPEKEKALQEMNDIFDKLGPKIDKFIAHKNEAYNQDKVHGINKERGNFDSGMKNTGSLD